MPVAEKNFLPSIYGSGGARKGWVISTIEDEGLNMKFTNVLTNNCTKQKLDS